MTAPLVLEFPDDPAEMGPWLDRQLVGVGLGRLVAELEAVHGGRGAESSPALDAVLSDQVPAVLESGLGTLPRPLIRELLRQPRLLLDLQERVLVDGGPHWARIQADDAGVAHLVDAGWPGVQSILATPAALPEETSPPTVPVPVAAAVTLAGPPGRPPRGFVLWAWARLATIVASAAIFLYAAEHIDPQPAEERAPALPSDPFAPRVEWGWNRVGVVDGLGVASDYLTGLADAANEWFDQRPSTAGELALRLGELRTGCSRLILADHDTLAQADREWLVARCRDWAGSLDVAVHELEMGDPVETVRDDVDTIVNRLVVALQDRASSL